MKKTCIPVWESGEYSFPHTFGFIPSLHSFLHEDDRKRPAVIVVPGGGYGYCSEREGQPTAKTFYDMGYQTFVFPYTCNPFFLTPLMDQPLRDLSRAMRIIRTKAEEFHIIPDQITVCGFSAGAHLAGTLGLYHEEVKDEKYFEISARPDLLLLCYPVITSGPFTHRDSMKALLGENPDDALLQKYSLEKNVTENTPPVFLFQTSEDESVPVENSCLMAQALKQSGVPFAHHIFTTGGHGLSIATQSLTDRVDCDPFPLEQLYCMLEAWERGEFSELDSDTAKAAIRKFYPRREASYYDPSKKPNYEVSIWPALADRWIQSMFEMRTCH